MTDEQITALEKRITAIERELQKRREDEYRNFMLLYGMTYETLPGGYTEEKANQEYLRRLAARDKDAGTSS